jgi:hypothetical protein
VPVGICDGSACLLSLFLFNSSSNYMDSHIINLGDILEYDPVDKEMDTYHGLEQRTNIQRSTSVEISVPKKYNSEEIRALLLTSGFGELSTQNIMDSYFNFISNENKQRNSSENTLFERHDARPLDNKARGKGQRLDRKAQVNHKQSIWKMIKCFFRQPWTLKFYTHDQSKEYTPERQ